MKKNNKFFTYVVLAAVMIIPFMYSFFYLKAYWNPYGEGNIDNIPVAIVNEDKGENGQSLIDSINDSGKLKISVIDKEEAMDGLDDGDYYAVIAIPSDFTESMESAGSKDKKHASITYSPNQKSNYLASQIINSVVNAVEKSLDNQVNSAIISELTETIEEVPSSLDKISDGFGKLKTGTSELKEGSNSLYLGTAQINTGITTLKTGINSAYLGSIKIESTIDSNINKYKTTNVLSEKQIEDIQNEVSKNINSNEISNQAWTQVQTKLANSNDDTINAYAKNAATQIMLPYFVDASKMQQAVKCATEYQRSNTPGIECGTYMASYNVTQQQLAADLTFISAVSSQLETLSGKTVNYIAEKVSKEVSSSTALSTAQLVSESVANKVANEVAITTLTSVKTGINELSTGLSQLNDGTEKLSTGSASLSTGAKALDNGITTLNNSVSTAKNELDDKICTTKEDVKTVETLAEYAKEPVVIKNETVNEVATYGTSFAPLFISIGLWVGALMFYVVLYYDKEKRFGFLGIDSDKYVKRTLGYHGLATIAGFILALMLQMFLDFEITNILLYYVSIILIANTFTAIVELLIANFGDIGKFLALIILVLQLASSGGTFPIETVTEGFRWLHNLLPMTYTIKLLRESLITIESTLLTKNLIIVLVMCVAIMAFNLFNSYRKQK